VGQAAPPDRPQRDGRFQLPTSTHVSREHTPPEVEQLCQLLEAAVEVVPDIAPLLTLGAVTGMRRGELVTIRRSRVHPDEGLITIDAATTGTRVKTTKTRRERKVAIGPDTMAMLQRHCAEMDDRAAMCGIEPAPDAFVFSLALDCATPMPPDYVTRRMAVLKEHLGIADKRPETVALEDEALAQFRSRPEPRSPGQRGRSPAGGLSYAAIGKRLGRSERWAALSVASALRRETRGPGTAATAPPSTARSWPCVGSRRASSSTPGSTSTWSPSGKATGPEFARPRSGWLSGVRGIGRVLRARVARGAGREANAAPTTDGCRGPTAHR
jgi:hypothetical protein